MGAIGLEPGDEVSTPWTMSATAVASVHWNGIPIFADIDPETYNLDPDSVRRAITPKTKAILAADIFGLPCDTATLSQIAKEHGLRFLTDSAQAPGARTKMNTAASRPISAISRSHYHKHIHCGEGDSRHRRRCLAERVASLETTQSRSLAAWGSQRSRT